MKKLVSILLVLLTSTLLMAANPIEKCKSKGIVLYGRVEYVEHGEDIRVKIVTSYFADLRVKIVDFTPYEIGEWQIVDFCADLKVKIVEHGEDLTIKFVKHDPGID